MKKTVLPLAVVALVLIGLVMMRNASETDTTIVEQVQLKRLTPDGMTQGDIARIEVYAGNDTESKLILAREASDAEEWSVLSHFNAPVKEDKITTFLEELEGLRGELRTTVSDDSGLADYSLTNEDALHVAAYPKDSDKPLFHVLVGKSPDYRSVFMRPEGSLDVFVEDSNLRSTAGLYGEELKAPEADGWLDKVVLAYSREDITGVDIKTPTKALAFKLEQPEPPATPEPAEGEDPPPPPPPAAPQWTLASGGPGLPPKQQGIEALVAKLSSLTAADIVDPSTPEAYGLDAPNFSCTITLEGRDAPVTLEGARKDASGPGYLRFANEEGALVYEVAKYNFDGLFPSGNTLFDLPKETITGDIDTLVIDQAEGRVALRKAGDTWTVEEPAVPLPVQTTTADAAASALKTWMPTDYADAGVETGLDGAKRTVTYTVGDKTYSLTLGNESSTAGGTYVAVPGATNPIVMGQTDVDKIFKAPKDFFQLALVEARDDEITAVNIQRGDDILAFTRTDDTWSVTSNGAAIEGELNQSAISELMVNIAGLQASDILLGSAALSGEAAATITVNAEGDRSYALQLGPEADGGRELVKGGLEQAFRITSNDASAIMPTAESLVAVEETPEHSHDDDTPDDHDHSDNADHDHSHEADTEQ